jgi:hypothetical protein
MNVNDLIERLNDAWRKLYGDGDEHDVCDTIAEAAAALEAAREDAERLDWLDSMNAKLNSHYGTTYRWELVLSPNVVRLMSGAGGNGHAAAIDLHDSEAHGTFTCREAIDRARGRENSND